MDDPPYEVQYPPGTEVKDTPDVLPPETWVDHYWYMANRWAETMMALARSFGFMRR